MTEKMKAFHFVMFAAVLLLNCCAEFEGSRNIDLAVDTYAPAPDALGMAETRAKAYWAKHREEIGPQTRYLAVQSDVIFSDEIPNLYAKVLDSPAVSETDLEDIEQGDEFDAYSVNIFDTRTERFVSPEGYAVFDLPRRGSKARFGTYSAVYIGSGT